MECMRAAVTLSGTLSESQIICSPRCRCWSQAFQANASECTAKLWGNIQRAKCKRAKCNSAKCKRAKRILHLTGFLQTSCLLDMLYKRLQYPQVLPTISCVIATAGWFANTGILVHVATFILNRYVENLQRCNAIWTQSKPLQCEVILNWMLGRFTWGFI